MDAEYPLAILWFFFACLTFGCLVGGNEPKVWKNPTKAEAFKVWLMSVFWPVTFLAFIFYYLLSKLANFLWDANCGFPWWRK